MHRAKTKMPVRPVVERTILLALNKSSVRQIEATASGAPCETMRPQVLQSPCADTSRRRRRFSGLRQWVSRIAIPTKCPTTVAADEPVMPQSSHWMKTMSSSRLIALSMMTASDTRRGLPSTPTMVDKPHMRMNAGPPMSSTCA